MSEERIDKIVSSIHNIDKNIAKIEVDIRHHIKRTDLLESKVSRIWYLVVLGAGAGIAEFGPTALKWLGIIQW